MAEQSSGRVADDSNAQIKFASLRLKFQSLLTQFDLFADTLTQRSEHEFGVWLKGLDLLAKDGLTLPLNVYKHPPLLCYLDRGIGAAIRRARTRLPGGRASPVAIIRVPRERMVGTGVAGSLIHEVGHQGASLLNLVTSLRHALKIRHLETGQTHSVWQLWQRWISEIISDFWSVAMIGIGATYGMIGVVTLPRAFIFRLSLDAPHPPPWVRVRLSATMGEALYPDQQWQKLIKLWHNLYPPYRLPSWKEKMLLEVDRTMPEFLHLLLNHKSQSLRGHSLRDVFPLHERMPGRLRQIIRKSSNSIEKLASLKPTVAFAALGQARADGKLDPIEEKRIVDELLTTWAMRYSDKPICGCSH